MGVAYKQMGMWREAERAYESALKIKPNSGVIFNNLGNVYTGMQRLPEAEVMYRRAIRKYPAYREAIYNLGQILYFMGRNDEALEWRLKLEALRLRR